MCPAYALLDLSLFPVLLSSHLHFHAFLFFGSSHVLLAGGTGYHMFSRYDLFLSFPLISFLVFGPPYLFCLDGGNGG